LRASEWLFVALKLLGAAYLVYLGVQLLRTRQAELTMGTGSPKTLWRLFFDGALSNVSNPKIAVFYFAFLPQFRHRGAAPPMLSLFGLGWVFAGLTFLVKGPVGVGAARLSTWLRARPRSLLWLYRTSGIVLVGLGVKLALERRP